MVFCQKAKKEQKKVVKETIVYDKPTKPGEKKGIENYAHKLIHISIL